jgi:hypothetical protein
MTGNDILDHTRKYVLRDFSVPPLFPDSLVLSYLDEAQQRVATRVHTFVTSTREVSISAGEYLYDLDEDIVHVYSARLDGIVDPLTTSTESWTPNDTTVSRPSRYTTDTETQTLRVYPIPDAAYTLILRVARLPQTLTLDNLDDELEISPRYQLALADWAAYRCFSNDDVDGRNDGAAEKALARFNMAIGEYKRDEYRLRTGHLQRVHGNRVK